LSLTRLPTDIDKLAAQIRLNHLTNYIVIIIIVLVYWFKVFFKLNVLFLWDFRFSRRRV
jgi:hypothetical protein